MKDDCKDTAPTWPSQQLRSLAAQPSGTLELCLTVVCYLFMSKVSYDHYPCVWTLFARLYLHHSEVTQIA